MLTGLWDKVKVLLGAVPTYGAAAVGVLVALQSEVIPLLPENLALRAAAWVGTAAGIIGAVVAVVSRVKPAPAAERGLLPPG